jgi:hypothetical protein
VTYKKLMICPWFGDEPAWAHRYHANASLLREHGYDFLHDRNLDEFRARVRDRLGIGCPIIPGSAKIHDFRPAFGELYRDELEGYDFWGHTDYDCVYGRIHMFATDELLDSCDIQTDNGYDYLCGPWTLYRNEPRINSLYTLHPDWADLLEDSHVYGWVETSFTDIAKREARVHRERFHRHTDPELLSTDGDGLMWADEEISFFHFRHTKTWPAVPLVQAWQS